MRTSVLCLILISVQVAAQDFQRDYYSGVFRADLSWVADVEPTSESDVELKESFERIILGGEPPSVLSSIENESVVKVVRRYEDYWRSAFLDPDNLAAHEESLRTDIATLLAANGIESSDKDPLDTLSDWLNRSGYGHRGGRTTPLLDFMLWSNTRTEDYEVDLTDGVQSVTVHFLQGFLVRGWSHFGTFGRASTGGWADKDALYCIEDAYDLESEKFTNNYLRHEARHYADYDLFPKLKTADLEYRAKLTELAFGTEQTKRLEHFSHQAALSEGAPHAIANWNVVKDVKGEIAKLTDAHAQQPASSEQDSEIAGIARALLLKNSEKLVEAGGSDVESVIRLPE